MGIKVKHFNERSVFTTIVDQSRIDFFVYFRFIFCITQEIIIISTQDSTLNPSHQS